MGVQAPPGLLGVHTNFPGAVRPDVSAAVQSGAPAPSGLNDEETRLFDKLKAFFATDVFYAYEIDPKGVTVPVAVSIFPDDLYQVPRSWAEQAYPQLIHYNRLDKGGHFAAWEQPKLYSEEVRAGLRPRAAVRTLR
jgi:pimeloyl-ACP methyl ester carboxylesterase